MSPDPQRLRQKAINLLYLIFLALIFSFIPSDFVDAVQKSDQSMTILCSEVEMQTNRYNAIVLSHLKGNPESFEITKLKIFDIDNLTVKQLDIIDEIKLELVQDEGYNQFGYLQGGKRERYSNELMIYSNKAKELFASLKEFKLDISQFVEVDQVDQIDSILPLREFETRSDGELVESEEFYFYKHPLTISMLNLSSFKSKVELIRSFVINDVVTTAVESGAYPIPSEIEKIITSDKEVIGNRDFIRVFNEEINWDSVIVSQNTNDLEKTKIIEEEYEANKDNISIESLTDSVYAVGKPVRFEFGFNAQNWLTVRLQDPLGEEVSYTLTKPGEFMFVPEIKGYYQLRFTNGVKSGRKNLKVLDLNPVLADNKMGTLYIGINNELRLKTSEFENTEGLQARISEGRILKRGKNFYARVNEEGQVRIEIFAKMPYGFVRVAEKQYVVRRLNPPVAGLKGKTGSSTVSLGDLSSLQSLTIKSDELLVEEEFYISGFDFTIIYNNHTAILRPISNGGNALNSTSLDALSRVTAGDILMFSNVKAKSSLGTEIEIVPITYTVIN